jgi:glycosyltransferase involved in cell wall biosynthesis
VTARARSALLIASNEICYNPRLLKAADCLLERGVAVSVFSPMSGNAPRALYDECIASRPWEVHSVDLSKATVKSRLEWAGVSVASRAALGAWHALGWSGGFHIVWNKSLVAFPWRGRSFDITMVNLVDNLPMAAALRRRSHGVLWYDSQEYFRGEGATQADPRRSRWVRDAEARFVHDADVVTTTTQVLADRLTAELQLPAPALRLRNAPLEARARERPGPGPSAGDPVRLVWHGFAIHLQGRGIDLLLDAISRCRQRVALTLQGRLRDDERARIEDRCRTLGIDGVVSFRPPAHPERIVESLEDQDAGVIPEPGVDENQRLTSSNKLFECIHAGLAVIAPDLPGLAETVAGEHVGELYRAGDAADLARAIDRVAAERDLRASLQRRALAAAPRLTWTQDFAAVWPRLEQALRRRRAGVGAPAGDRIA